MTVTTGLLVASLALLGACNNDEPEPGPETPAPTQTTDAPTDPEPTSSITSADDLVGTWEDTRANWAVTFNDDGTFSEDYEGIEGFRTGEYSFDDGRVSLQGGDGQTDEGTVEGETLVFTLGTLTRK